MRVLVVAPHPDDEVLGCGGTIARHVDEGDTVDVVVVTRGDGRYDQEWVEQSRKESLEAHRLLGVTATRFLDFPSPSLDTVPSADLIVALVAFTGYDVVYIPHRGDLHQEHRQIHRACLVAFRPPGPDLYAYETLSSTECGDGFTPNHFVDITGQVARKEQAMLCYRTQIQESPAPRSSAGIRTLAQMRGQTVHRHFAEAFIAIRTTR